MTPGIMDATDAAAAYKASARSSETPDMDWLLRAWRGLRTYLMRAAAATERGDLQVKLGSLDKASKLLVLLQGIMPDNRDSPLATRLRGLYTSFHLRLMTANAQNDVAAMRDLADQLSELDSVFSESVVYADGKGHS
jgi:flagellar biosynthetic protein FliS